jgi:hypothetical protein
MNSIQTIVHAFYNKIMNNNGGQEYFLLKGSIYEYRIYICYQLILSENCAHFSHFKMTITKV